ncbi:E3 ubiquitin-protein ligase RNF26 isoform X2 [Toxotes jaculatrix]|uniref:E3 ubiquitin-protein ligase RNF26 isoform X2 n=1 Tax=Toxotes jaculatrix TaxID=941984 RepID=UPI001B3ABCA0|nr:E3 ubiquitin-protein ligase RNF26 isoform X2 [Toxotes jaculatrix]
MFLDHFVHGKCLDAVCLLLDLNFLIVHTVVRTLLAILTFITNLPTMLLASALELGNLIVFCLMSVGEATSNVAHGTVTMLGSLVLSLEGLLESLKMVGYLSMHVLLRGKEHLCRGLLWVLEGCSIAVSLVVYFTNTVVNFVLIATQNVYLALVSVWQMVSSPLQKVLELTLTSFTFLYSSLVGTSAFLWSPCKLVLDFLVSLVHMFISIFILNIYGLMLTVTIALTTTAYLNPVLTRQAAVRILDYINSFPALRRLYLALHRLASAMQSTPLLVRGNMQRLQRILHHLYLLERGLWQHLSRHSSQLGLALRTHLHRDNNNRVRGDGDPGEERRGLPDGRAGDGAHQELLDLALPSSSTDRPLKKQSSSGKDSNKPLPAENLLTLLKEQEDRKKCVICQDCTKTVVLLPCRHLCLCRDCTNILLRQPIYQQNCPLCRHMILNTMDVYL